MNPDTRFIVVGEGLLLPEMKSLVSELNVENRVFLTGVSEAVHFWMEKADLLMHLAIVEGLANVIIEAQIMGTPVLATPAGGTPEIVEHGETGHLLSDSNELSEQEILDSLELLLNDNNTL